MDETKNCTVDDDVGACVCATIAKASQSLLLLEYRLWEEGLVFYGWSTNEVHLPHR